MSVVPKKSTAQRARILALLRERGPTGATNRELNSIGFRYGARLWELKKQGYAIRTVRVSESVFRFVLVRENERPAPLPSSSRPHRSVQSSLFAEAV